MTITLTWHEVAEAAREGCNRRIRRLAKGRRDRYGWDQARDAWGSDIEAAAAELAVAKALDCYWAPDPAPDYAGDVGVRRKWQVRTTDREAGCLILYPEDADAQRFALAIGAIPKFTLRGWIVAADGKREEFAAGARLRVPGFLVPQHALSPMGAAGA